MGDKAVRKHHRLVECIQRKLLRMSHFVVFLLTWVVISLDDQGSLFQPFVSYRNTLLSVVGHSLHCGDAGIVGVEVEALCSVP